MVYWFSGCLNTNACTQLERCVRDPVSTSKVTAFARARSLKKREMAAETKDGNRDSSPLAELGYSESEDNVGSIEPESALFSGVSVDAFGE